jgi:sulfonate transport system ATP-binding protein
MSTPLHLAGIRKRYDGVVVLGGVSLDVDASEIVAVVGPSGCGKSTLLRLVAGLDVRFDGRIVVGERDVCGPDRAVGVVFQEPRLFPWLSVADNVGFGLADRGSARAHELVRETLDVVGLAAFADALPKELSGGMAQRVALARALVTEPQVLLLDEPFSSLDAFTRMRLQDHLLAAWSRYRPTLVLVTHDLDEAVYLADRVVLLTDRPARVSDVLRVAADRRAARGAPPRAERARCHRLSVPPRAYRPLSRSCATAPTGRARSTR